MCGSSQPPPDDKHHDIVLQLANLQQNQNSVVQKHSSALETLFWLMITVLAMVIIFFIYKAVIRYERMKTTNEVRRAVTIT